MVRIEFIHNKELIEIGTTKELRKGCYCGKSLDNFKEDEFLVIRSKVEGLKEIIDVKKLKDLLKEGGIK